MKCKFMTSNGDLKDVNYVNWTNCTYFLENVNISSIQSKFETHLQSIETRRDSLPCFKDDTCEHTVCYLKNEHKDSRFIFTYHIIDDVIYVDSVSREIGVSKKCPQLFFRVPNIF